MTSSQVSVSPSSSPSWSNERAWPATVARMPPCVIITPLGWPVVPLVYIIVQTSSRLASPVGAGKEGWESDSRSNSERRRMRSGAAPAAAPAAIVAAAAASVPAVPVVWKIL